ncbi:hypothetical protein BAG01nite_45380 [Brevibacillus agri]|uniref:GNAT family N-acetyltransferase n=1 Tax=Brevibacillus agri TaxID=51101 RepID=A0A3M8ARR7_9BACL|nr:MULTISPECIES: GNAT family N-acetyltransferase [Brevibacillus]ELK39669.1 acetyltransferase [Brevibacillus agri BAB-2500]EJL41944.1 putative acetyltransferase [Brevibacillus sp. CF112]MCG5254160.1 GNAT family N-acetyltransferase [Brevibacillus agri]MDN4095868.1 GNAT family N-acetyltransferase [Brevibacillus agri]MDR9506700.1 GNAT family N-acetyltransferase [Brevibacillus agri]
MTEPSVSERSGLLIREFDPQRDSLEALTRLLNTAYQTLAEMGFHFVAASQDAATTAKRIASATCLVGLLDGQIIATISYYPPAKTKGTPWYDEPFVAKFGQFAVDHRYRKHGIGSLFIQRAEELAIADGATELALDTAEGAEHLRRYYAAKGYRFIAYAQWSTTNYRSVLMSKRLSHD